MLTIERGSQIHKETDLHNMISFDIPYASFYGTIITMGMGDGKKVRGQIKNGVFKIIDTTTANINIIQLNRI